MNYRRLLIVIFFVFSAIVQVSCKDNVPVAVKKSIPQKKVIAVLSKPVEIDSLYQKDEPIDRNNKLGVKSIIHFESKYNSPKKWQYETSIEGKIFMENFNTLSNGTIINVLENYKEGFSTSKFSIIIVDKNGKEIRRQKIGDGKSKYSFNESWIEDNHNDQFVIYVKKELPVWKKKSDNTMRMNGDSISRFQIEKMVFKNTNSGYSSQSVSILDVLFKPLQKKGFSYLDGYGYGSDEYYFNDKIFIVAMAKNANQKKFPFIAVFDKNLKLLKVNVFTDCENTWFDSMFLNTANTLYARGPETIKMNVYESLILKRFVINKDLKIVKNYSDNSTGYYDRYERMPTRKEEREINRILKKKSKVKVEKSISKNEYVINDHSLLDTFYRDINGGCYYSKPRFDSENKIEFYKTRRSDGANLWKVIIMLPKNYSVSIGYENNIWYESTVMKGIKCVNGDFILARCVKVNSNTEGFYFAMVVFVFNKEGRLIRQFEIPGLEEIKGLKESNGKLIVSCFDDGNLINSEWYIY